MKDHESLPVGVVLTRQRIGHPWQEFSWHATEVVPGAPAVAEWRLLRQAEARTAYLAATLPLDLYPGETADYRHNLSQRQPMIYVVLRRDEGDAERPIHPFHVTASPAEAQDYLDSDDLVDAVPMPPGVAAWLQDYVTRFHVERAFVKRGRGEREARRKAQGRGNG
jgi:hypothetical protein